MLRNVILSEVIYHAAEGSQKRCFAKAQHDKSCHSELSEESQHKYPKTYNLKPSYKAFTFIEMAIVLVIIGMMTAGVIGANSLIKSSKISSMISEINEVKTAVNGFKLQFDGNLPGDFKNATDYWSDTGNGDGDGKVEPFAHTYPNHENLRFFQHLSLSGLIKGQFDVVGYPLISRPDRPSSYMETAINSEAGYLPYSIPVSSSSHDSFEAFYSNAYESGLILKAAGERVSGSSHDAGFISPKLAYKIDVKYDDGSPDSGEIRGSNGNAIGYSGTAVRKCTSNDANSASWLLTSADSYDLSISDPHCMMFFFLERENI